MVSSVTSFWLLTFLFRTCCFYMTSNAHHHQGYVFEIDTEIFCLKKRIYPVLFFFYFEQSSSLDLIS